MKLGFWNRRRVVLAAVVAVVIVFAALVYAGFKNADHRRQAEIEACHRVNKLREAVNVNGQIIHDVLEETARNSRALARQGPSSLSPTRLRAAHNLEQLARRTRHTAATDCVDAVDHPRSYRAPSPKPF